MGSSNKSGSRFQFLLVRLKENYENSKIYNQFISIPTGTIKSIRDEINELEKKLFQFLLVRLKVFNKCVIRIQF